MNFVVNAICKNRAVLTIPTTFKHAPICPVFAKGVNYKIIKKIFIIFLKSVFHGASFYFSKIEKGPKMAKLACVNFDLLSTFPQKILQKALTTLRDNLKPLKPLAFGHFSTDFRFFDRFRIPLTPRSFWAALHLHRTNRRREKPTGRVVYRVIVV